MQITRKSRFSGKTRTRELDITNEQIKAYESGAALHTAFPNISAYDREFYNLGITKEEWEIMFPDNQQDEYTTDAYDSMQPMP